MLRIYKYPFEVRDDFYIEMPKGASVLTVQVQYGAPCIWAMVDDGQPVLESHRFRIFGTGHPVDIDPTLNRYVGTFQLLEGQFVGHLFELIA